jgi:acyl-CoA synthetase (AMP-forming)/AMP-acid ligase II
VGSTEGVDLNYEQMLAAASPVDSHDVTLGEDDDHIIRFSAGTTGRPKGILHSVRGWREMGNEFALVLPRMRDTDAYLVAAPLSHAAGLLLWPLIAHGCRHVIMPAFHPGRFLDLVESERCTLTFLVPTMIQMVATEPGAGTRDLSSLRMVLYGASPITERTLRESIGLWGNIMYQVYGQSEALPATVLTPQHHVLDDSEQNRRYLRSAGRITPNSAVAILDDQDVEVPSGELGEICVKSPGAMKAIWGDPEATALRITAAGYVRSRDIGYLDDRGFLYLADRKEDMIISGGFNVWPAEVENALASHPAVQEAAVVGVPDQKWGEAVLAVVVLREQQQATEQELIDWARQKVGRIKKPSRIEFSTEPLPKSPVGKMIRRLVRERFGSTGQHIHGA